MHVIKDEESAIWRYRISTTGTVKRLESEYEWYIWIAMNNKYKYYSSRLKLMPDSPALVVL